MAKYISIDGKIKTPESISYNEFVKLFTAWLSNEHDSCFVGFMHEVKWDGSKIDSNNDTIGKRMLSLMCRTRMTQKELAELTGTTEVSISRYISGQRIPKYTIVSKIANALNTSNDYLIRGYESKGE